MGVIGHDKILYLLNLFYFDSSSLIFTQILL